MTSISAFMAAASGLSDSIHDALSVPLFVKDADGRFVFCNQAFSAFLGREKGDILGRTVFDLAPPDLAETYHRADADLRADGGPQRYESDVVSARHGPRRVLFDKVLAPAPDGQSTLIVGLIHDITDLSVVDRRPEERNTLQHTLARFSAGALDSPFREAAHPIRSLLADMGMTTGVDRTTLVRLDAGGTRLPAEEYDWTRRELDAHAGRLGWRCLDRDLPWLARRLRTGAVVDIADVEALPPEASADRDRLSAVAVRATLMAPLRRGATTIGLLVLDCLNGPRSWSAEEVSDLRLIAHTLAQSIDRDRIQAALRASERNFRAFFESMDDLIVVSAPDGRIVHVNSAANRLLGFNPDSLVGQHVRDLHPAAMREQADAVLARLLRGEGDVCDLPMVTRDGRVLHVETRTWTGVWDGRACLFGLSKDITAVREAESWFERLFRNNPAPMALTGLEDGTFVDVNDAFMTTTGYRRDEAVGRTPQALSLFPDPEAHAAATTRLRETGRLSAAELRIRRKDGRILCGLFHGDVITSRGQRTVLTVMIDVTGRKLAEDALAKSEERLRLAMEAASDGIWDWDITHDRVEWNARCYTMLGYPPGAFAVSFQKWSTLLHPEDRANTLTGISSHIMNGEAFALEFRLRRADDSWLWVLGRGRPVTWDAEGTPTRAVGTHTAIDAMKRVEQSLIEAREAAEQASRAKSEFLASMSHELRTPLNSIIGFSSLLLSPEATAIPEERARGYLNDIRGSGQHLLELISDILDLSAIEAGKVILYEDLLDIADLCRNCLRLMEERARGGGVTLRLEAGPSCPSHLFADERRVRQVLLNLLSNAVKFTPAGGRVTLSVTREPEDGGLALAVADTGIGMNAAAVETAMTPFEQVDNVFSRRFDGIGLGLPLTARLMELHGGTLSLDSTPGEGTTATALFPPDRVRAAP